MDLNYRVFLKSRPGVCGEPSENNFGYESVPYPDWINDDGGSEQSPNVLVKTLYLSVDPAQRCLLNDESGIEYLKSLNLGDTVVGMGLGVVMAVIHSSVDGPKVGDLVTSGSHGFTWPWQLYFICNMNKLEVVDVTLIGTRPTLVLSFLGLIGLTSLLGIREKGRIVRGVDRTIVVSGAAGACGSLAGQIARLEGIEFVIGICGSEEKCRFLVEELGFDDAINYKSDDINKKLKKVCPNGVDIYFDNVGGEISDTVIQQMNSGGRIILCGQISQYNKDVPYPPPLPENITEFIERNKIKRERFLILHYKDKFQESLIELGKWLINDKLKVKETFEEGLEYAGRAFVKMMRGDNIGKQLVHVADV